MLDAPRHTARVELARRVPLWAWAIAVYLAVRAVGVGVLAVMTPEGETLLDQLTAWDGHWYLGIAEHGYTGHGEGTVDADGEPYPSAPFAFFPLLPSAMSIVATLGLPLDLAGIAVATAAGIVAAPALLRLAGHVDPRPTVGLLLVALTASAPMSSTLSMVYTEAPFLACACWALVGVVEHRWALAGTCTLLAGLTRSTAVVLIAVVVAAALWRTWRHRAGWAPLSAVVLAPLGLLGWWGTVHVWTGHTWQEIELRGWGVAWDWGADTWAWITRAVAGEAQPYHVLAVAVLLAAAVLAVAGARLPWPLALYGAGVVTLAVGSGGLPQITPRVLLAAAPVLLLPVAAGLAHRRPATIAAVTGVWIVGGSWYSAYALTVWPYAI
ncbi:hypothetical protein B1813_19110 [Saccharomonospora piscinae]|uniref:Integral membrane protein n=1 Tax=Saccharomonospora piscinae TaxID=687388 RepID=A0A1V8ZYX7_SACPI|nr:hypothetical protein B1813_19110 [Saccharomonospora piscinae]